jgi:hypothetical protein
MASQLVQYLWLISTCVVKVELVVDVDVRFEPSGLAT